MKILIIHGSPRRGNTWKILNKVKEKINEEIDADYEIIELSKMKIPMCTGCFNCILKSEEKCPHYESIKYINDKGLGILDINISKKEIFIEDIKNIVILKSL